MGDDNKPRSLGPKRAANIRKVFNLTKEDNVCQYVVRREAGKKKKAPKVQRLITKQRLQRTRRLKAQTLAGIVASREAKKDWTADSLGDEFKGYVFQISGGNDKQGFPMMQGVLT